MTKETKKEDVKEVVNQPAGAPIAPDAGEAIASRDVLSHQWQKDSPAINTNVLAGYGVAATDNIVNQIDTPEKEKARKDSEKLVADECARFSDEERSRLDVSDRCYLNPSLGHSGKKAK